MTLRENLIEAGIIVPYAVVASRPPVWFDQPTFRLDEVGRRWAERHIAQGDCGRRIVDNYYRNKED